MPRKMRTLADIRSELGQAELDGRRLRFAESHGGLDFWEILSAVCKYFTGGNSVAEIRNLMEKNHKVRMKREEPYKYIAFAASRGWIRFIAPAQHALREQIKNHCGWLHDVEVVHTAVVDDVMYKGAEMLRSMVRQVHLTGQAKEAGKVHVGFAGGHSMRMLARTFADLLRQPAGDLPETIVFHALVAGFDVADPMTDPNAFFTYFFNDPTMQVSSEFVGLHTPALVKTKRLAELRQMEGIHQAYDRAEQLDIIVTSATLCSDPHSLLYKYMSRSASSLRKLQSAGWVGDMLWRPMGSDGPIEVDTDIRAMTVVELSELPKRIAAGTRVLLSLGPCGVCGARKTELLRTILNMKQPLITHLAVDSRSASEFFRRS